VETSGPKTRKRRTVELRLSTHNNLAGASANLSGTIYVATRHGHTAVADNDVPERCPLHERANSNNHANCTSPQFEVKGGRLVGRVIIGAPLMDRGPWFTSAITRSGDSHRQRCKVFSRPFQPLAFPENSRREPMGDEYLRKTPP
jgi:hypothetical protein